MKLTTIILVGLVAFLTLAARAQSFTSIYSFQGGSTGDGASPQAGLIHLQSTFYGTTTFGGGTGCGGAGCGTAFALSPPKVKGGAWTEAVIYAFTGGSDGANPYSSLLNFRGSFYGTTQAGGGTGCGGGGCGTIFKLSPPHVKGGKWTEAVLYSFAGGNDGEQPVQQLINISGTLYGVTVFGGGGSGCFDNIGCGTVFSFDLATGSEGVFHAFDGADGSNPNGGLLNHGSFIYGTTYRGGAGTGCVLGYGCGTAFKINKKTHELTLMHSFSADGSDGASPQATLINVGGTLYGTTNLDGTGGCGPPYGCGTVFAMNRAGVVTPLHQFTGGSDGQHPTAPMIYVGGLFYGTTQGGVTPNTGAVFQINPTTGDEKVLYEFSNGGTDGAGANAPLLNVRGTFYSTTSNGGLYGYGTVYSITP